MNDPLAIILLIVGTCAVSIWGFHDPEIERRYIFRPESILADKEYYRLVSSAFLHGGWGHLLLNLYTLYAFGPTLCRVFGQWHFLVIYFGSVVGGSLLSLYLHRHHDYTAYGASSGVCGLIFAYVLKFPESRLSLFPLPYAVPGWVYALAFLVASFYAMKRAQDNIGHDAHLGGAGIGLLITAGLHPELVDRHWAVFIGMLVTAGLIFAYLLVNPLFLPLSSVVELPAWRFRRNPARKPAAARNSLPRRVANGRVVSAPVSSPPSDWLVQEIEVQVGKLEKDPSDQHDWIDKFGRTYDVIKGNPKDFELASFTQAILDRLNTPTVKFVIVDTRELYENQVNLVRPFLADLPDAQFNRVIRSFAFTPKE